MINRAAIIIRYKEPAIAWLNEVDPYEDGSEVTMEDANHESTVYLIGEDDAYSYDTVEEWVRMNYGELFEAELEEWNTAPALWPADRSYKVFWEWFDIEVHSVVVDTVGSPIYDEDEFLPPDHLDS